ANQPAYSRASTPHPPSTMMWQTFLPSLLCLFLQLKFCLSLRQCRWLVALSETKNIEGLISSYIYQEELRNVAEIFRDLKDSPIDPSDKDAVNPARILTPTTSEGKLFHQLIVICFSYLLRKGTHWW
uniref:CATSPERG N-terminal domain-containing protein n=1 Tax=Naja naja TaxID=35670 RepID=A0A8C6X372_NAJNA